MLVERLVGLFAHDFLAPYASPLGQLILAVLGAMVAGCLAWMIRIARIPDLPRILTQPDGFATAAAEEGVRS